MTEAEPSRLAQLVVAQDNKWFKQSSNNAASQNADPRIAD
jgi:hypothetical protein